MTNGPASYRDRIPGHVADDAVIQLILAGSLSKFSAEEHPEVTVGTSDVGAVVFEGLQVRLSCGGCSPTRRLTGDHTSRRSRSEHISLFLPVHDCRFRDRDGVRVPSLPKVP